MRIIKTSRRSGPIYRKRDGRIISYVRERVQSTLMLGPLGVKLPVVRRMHVIDERGVHTISEGSAWGRGVWVCAALAAAVLLYRGARQKKGE